MVSKKKAFTLVELMTVLAIAGIVLIGIFYFTNHYQKAATEGINWVAFQSRSQAKFEEMCRELRKGSAFQIENSGQKLTITLPSKTSVFSKQGDKLYRNDGNGDFEFQDYVNSVQFTSEKQDTLLQVMLLVEYQGKQEKMERKVFLKNHP